MKVLAVIFLLLLSGCLSRVSVIEPSHPRGSAAPVTPIVPFEDVDIDGNGTIERLEYYEMAKQINTEDPIWGLLLILFAVIFCTVVAALAIRFKK
jgi:hypothetical protein